MPIIACISAVQVSLRSLTFATGEDKPLAVEPVPHLADASHRMIPTIVMSVVDARGVPCMPSTCLRSASHSEPCHFIKQGTAGSKVKCAWTPAGPVLVKHQKYWCTEHKATFVARPSYRSQLTAPLRLHPDFVHLGKVTDAVFWLDIAQSRAEAGSVLIRSHRLGLGVCCAGGSHGHCWFFCWSLLDVHYEQVCTCRHT